MKTLFLRSSQWWSYRVLDFASRPIKLCGQCVILALLFLIPVVLQAGPLKAGAAVIDVSPRQFPVIVNCMFTERKASEMVDPLFARCLVLDNGAMRVAIVLVDSCMMPRSLIDQARQKAGEVTGIAIDRMLIAATHTHSAPSVMGCLGSRADLEYAEELPIRIAEAIARANRNLVPARAGWAVVDDWNHTFNRRWIRRPDSKLEDPFGQRSVRAHMHPGHQSPNAIGPSGPVDPGLSLLAVQSADGHPLAVLANYSQHYYGSPLISSDYFGRFAGHFARMIEAESAEPAFVAMMSQGTSGDLMWMDYGAPPTDVGYDAYAEALARSAVAAYKTIEYHLDLPIEMAEEKLVLNYRVPSPERLAWAEQLAGDLDERLPVTLPEIYALEAIRLRQAQKTELVLQSLRIGELGITAIPNEVYAITGLKLKLQSPLQPTFNISLANGAEGYIPPPEQHHLGGYTTWPARTAGLEVEAEPKIVEVLLRLLERTSGQPRRSLPEHHGPYREAVLALRPFAYWPLNEILFPDAFDASGHDRTALYEPGIALYLPGVGSGSGISPQPQLIPSAFSASHINRAPHFAGGRLLASVKGLGADYTLDFWLWNGLPIGLRSVTGYLYELGRDQLGILGAGDHAGRLFFIQGTNRFLGRTQLPLKEWTRVTVVRQPDKVSVYLNGGSPPEIEEGLDFPWHNPGHSQDGATLFLGGDADNDANFEGKLDEVALFDRALKVEEMAGLQKASGM